MTYWDTLPKKRMGAGCLIFDEDGRVLLVKPNYKPVWEIPGGVVEANESPKQCCQREVEEELGLHLIIGRLLVVDYNNPTEVKTESIMFIFDGGILTQAEITALQLQTEELSGYSFFAQNQLPHNMTDSLKNRVLIAWNQSVQNGALYTENQREI